MKYYLKLIRIKNLLIIAASFYIIRFTLFEVFIDSAYINYPLNHFQFFLLCISTILIAAAGNIINDIKDVESDIANKKIRRIVKHKISTKNAYKYYFFLNALGLISAIFLAVNSEAIYLIIIHLFAILILYYYSNGLKCSGILGNISIAFLTAMVPLMVLIYFLVVGDSDMFFKKIQQFDLLFIILAYAVFAFLINLIREIAKDVEDRKGDKKYNCKTIAVRWSINKIKKTLLFLFIASVLSIVFLGLVFLNSSFYVFATGILVIPVIMLIDLLPTILTAKSIRDYKHISKSTKVVLAMGLLFLILVYFV